MQRTKRNSKRERQDAVAQSLATLLRVAEGLCLTIAPRAGDRNSFAARLSTVFLSESIAGERLLFTLAHELGHAEQESEGFRGEVIDEACQSSDVNSPGYSEAVDKSVCEKLEPDAWIRGQRWIAPLLLSAYRERAKNCLATYSLPSPFEG